MRTPNDTILVLISDLYEGGNHEKLLRRAGSLVNTGVQVITLLALSNQGAPASNHCRSICRAWDSLLCMLTPDQFPDLMAAAIKREAINHWVGAPGIVTARIAET